MGAHCGLPGGQLWIRTKLTLVVMKINKGTGGHKGAWVLFTLKASWCLSSDSVRNPDP